MSICDFVITWPGYRTVLVALLFLFGCASTVLTAIFFYKTHKKHRILTEGGLFWRCFMQIHQTPYAKAVTVSSIVLALLIGITQYKTYGCYFSNAVTSRDEIGLWFFLFLWLFCALGDQGLYCYFEPNLKLSWDRSDIISVHLGGKPDEITDLVNSDFPKKIDSIAKDLEKRGLPRTLSVESWLFFRPKDEIKQPELESLREALHFPDVISELDDIASQPSTKKTRRRKMKLIATTYVKLFFKFSTIVRLLYRLDAPKRPSKNVDIENGESFESTAGIRGIIRKLQNADPERRVIILPFRRMRALEVINLIGQYPHLSKTFYPWSSGFQILK